MDELGIWFILVLVVAVLMIAGLIVIFFGDD